MDERKRSEIESYLDSVGRVILWPAKRWHERRMLILDYLASKFELNRTYREAEVNDVLKQWLVFSDHALMRRELIDTGRMQRHRDGTAYWRSAES